jgi:hypothetical protein
MATPMARSIIFSVLCIACAAHAQSTADNLDPYYYVARAADPVAAVTQEFAFYEATSSQSIKVLRQCLPHQTTTALDNLSKSWKPHEGSAGTTGSMVTNLRGAPILVYDAKRIACVPRAVAGHVVFPAAAFRLALAYEGIEDAVEREWAMQIARTFAARGFATVRFELNDGSAKVVVFTSPSITMPGLETSSAPARFEPGTLDYRITQPSAAAPVDLTLKHASVSKMWLRPYRASFRLTPLDSSAKPNMPALP